MKENLFDSIPASGSEELFTTLLERPGVHLERIVSFAHASPEGFWYDQSTDEWVLLLEGHSVLSVQKEGAIEQVELTPGDYLFLPANCRHRVESTAERTVWLALHLEKER